MTIEDRQPAQVPAPAPQAAAANSPTVVPITRPAASAAPTLRLGVINQRIAPLSITQAGLAALGFAAAAHERSAIFYHESDWSRICDSIVAHVRMAQNPQQAA